MKKPTRTFLIGTLIGAIAGGALTFGGAYIFFDRSADAGGPLFAREEGVSRGAGEETLRYTHPRYGFSLEFPKELAVARYPEGNASETVVFQKPGDRLGFQVFVTPYAGETLTEERLRQDAGGAVEEPVEAVIGDGIRALIFWSEDPAVGRLREAWFIHGGFLYEVVAYAELDAWLAEILATWRFGS